MDIWSFIVGFPDPQAAIGLWVNRCRAAGISTIQYFHFILYLTLSDILFWKTSGFSRQHPPGTHSSFKCTRSPRSRVLPPYAILFKKSLLAVTRETKSLKLKPPNFQSKQKQTFVRKMPEAETEEEPSTSKLKDVALNRQKQASCSVIIIMIKNKLLPETIIHNRFCYHCQ